MSKIDELQRAVREANENASQTVLDLQRAMTEAEETSRLAARLGVAQGLLELQRVSESLQEATGVAGNVAAATSSCLNKVTALKQSGTDISTL